MSAQVIAFPTRKADAERLTLVGQAIKVAVPVTSRNAELDLLLQIGAKLLDNLNDMDAVDGWVARVDAWEAVSKALP